jgi:hypothetical protein
MPQITIIIVMIEIAIITGKEEEVQVILVTEVGVVVKVQGFTNLLDKNMKRL